MDYPLCDMCERPMRPTKSPKALHPGTVSRGIQTRCVTCHERKRTKPDKMRAAAIDPRIALAKWLTARRRRIAHTNATITRLQAAGFAA